MFSYIKRREMRDREKKERKKKRDRKNKFKNSTIAISNGHNF
jgi:hypothetical protein